MASLDSYLKNASMDSSKPVVEMGVPFYEVILAATLCSIIAASVGGNLLVCVAVCTDRHLRKRSNSLYVSLAVADLLLALVVMTSSVANQVEGQWLMGPVFCNIYLSMDVMCCTASILNILAVAIDRYEHIRRPFEYDYRMTRTVFLVIIVFTWAFSALISFLPIHLGWHKTSQHNQMRPVSSFTALNDSLLTTRTTNPPVTLPSRSPPNVDNQNLCVLELNMAYAITSSMLSFGLPCMVMVFLYLRLYLFAQSHAKRLASTQPSFVNFSRDNSLHSINCSVDDLASAPGGTVREKTSNGNGGMSGKAKRQFSSDHKAAITLGVIMGTFLVCWLPFFIINCIESFCQCISANVFFAATWLGYFNSCLNPVIYPVFNLEFRHAFRKILCTSSRSDGPSKCFSFSSRQSRYQGSSKSSHSDASRRHKRRSYQSSQQSRSRQDSSLQNTGPLLTIPDTEVSQKQQLQPITNLVKERQSREESLPKTNGLCTYNSTICNDFSQIKTNQITE